MKLQEKDKPIPLENQIGPEGSRRLTLPEFSDNLHMKMEMLSALYSRCLHHGEDPLVLISVSGLVHPRVSVAGRIKLMKNLINHNRTFQFAGQCFNQTHYHVP
jgi:hypothetical protein